MRAKLPADKIRNKTVRLPVNVVEKQRIEELAAAREATVAELLRGLVRRECQSVKGAKKTKAA